MPKQETHNGLTCLFDEANHTYTIKETGQVLTSVTTFIKQFFPVFDTDAISKKTAKKRGVDVDGLKAEWKQMGEDASAQGDMVHRYAEYLMNIYIAFDGPENDPRFKQVKIACKILKSKFHFAFAEKIIFSPDLGLAGMIDLWMVDVFKDRIILIDWKTNKELKDINAYQSGLPPIEHLDDCNYNCFALQLSLYQYIMIHEKYSNTPTTFQRVIIHIGKTFNKPYIMPYLKDEIERMLFC